MATALLRRRGNFANLPSKQERPPEMEARNPIREAHGIANARRVAAVSVEQSDIQGVTVTDGRNGEVQLGLSSSSFPAGLTPSQARMIAKMLTDSAERSEAA